MMSASEAVATSRKGRAYGGVSLQARRRERHARLLEAGVDVFGREGFHAATVKRLCREAGLTERYFYESFANSEALFAQVYKTLAERLQADIVAAVQAAAHAAPVAPEAAAGAGLRVFFETMYNRPEVARILLIEIFGISGEIDKLYRATTQNFTRRLHASLRAIFDLEHTPGADAELLWTGLIGSTIHIAMYWTLDGYRDPLDTVVESSLALYTAVARPNDSAEPGPPGLKTGRECTRMNKVADE